MVRRLALLLMACASASLVVSDAPVARNHLAQGRTASDLLVLQEKLIASRKDRIVFGGGVAMSAN
jgi:hypothetical protein